MKATIVTTMPFLSVKDKKVRGKPIFILQLKIGKNVFEFPATKDGLLECGRYLADRNYEEWLCSSSVDAVDEYDIRSIVNQGYCERIEHGNAVRANLLRKIAFVLKGNKKFLETLNKEERDVWKQTTKALKKKV